MNPQEERRNKIIELLETYNYLSVIELSETLLYSEATIKRDLTVLANDGIIRRTRGGAAIIDEKRLELPYLMKISGNERDKAKTNMALKALELIKDDMVIFLDSSSTALHIVYELNKFNNIKVITNGLLTASLLTQSTDAKVFVIGGEVYSKRFTINGSKAYSDTLTYSADIAFMSCRGFDFNIGATEVSEDEALIKKAFYTNASTVVLMVNQNKLNLKYTHQSVPSNRINYMITDGKLSYDIKKRLKGLNIKVLDNE